MIGLPVVYVFAGLVFAAMAILSARDSANAKRWANAAFWGLFSLSFLAGNLLGDFGNGVLVLAMVLIAGTMGLGLGRSSSTSPEQRQALSRRFGNRLFVPALVIPAVTLAGSLTLKNVPLFDPAQVTLVSLAIGVLLALFLARIMLHQPVLAAFQEGRKLMDLLGWASLLPQMLAALGAVFALAGVGQAVGGIAMAAIPDDNPFAAVAAYTIGMALFTAIMGNAFAAFPVMTAGIGLPLIVGKFGGDPAIMSAIGMLSGFCGTLTTPMAANFNLVPAALLGLKDRYAVIKAQIPTALLVLAGNTVLMYALVFRH
ncbi:MAG TPA: DUF979 domain-containing protein [Micropepsaceae bacterium]|jgi:uncharacterized membrane protein|nr:DUF979 domain-containing protein [Micropepsaceae bacterium]